MAALAADGLGASAPQHVGDAMKANILPAEALTQHIGIVGKTGSGKTTTGKLVVEEVVPTGARVCVLDPIKSDWWGLTSSADGREPGLPFHILGGLHSGGLVEYEGGRVRLTVIGRAKARIVASIRSNAELHQRLKAHLDGPGQKILDVVIAAHPKPVHRASLASQVGYEHPRSKGFINSLGRLRTLGFIHASPVFTHNP